MFLRSATWPFVRSEWRFLLFGLLLTFWSGPGQTYVISLIGGEIRRDFALSHSAFGGLYTAATLLSAACLWKAGPLVDRLPLKTFVFKMALLMVVVTGLFSFVQGTITLFLGIFALRFAGQGMLNHIALTAMARRYEKERGRALAIAGLGFPLGEALFPPLVVVGLTLTDWRALWFILAAVMAVILLPLIPKLIVHTAEQDGGGALALNSAAVSDDTQWTRAEMLKDRRFYLLALTPITQSGIITALFFHQVHLISLKDWDFGWWSLCFTFFAIFSLIGGLISGFLVDIFRARTIVPALLLPLAAGLVVFGHVSHPAFAAVLMAILGFGAGASNPALSALWPELYGTEHLGAIRSVFTVVMVFGSALGPVLLGAALDAQIEFEKITWFLAGITIVAGLLASLSLRKRSQ